MSETTTEFTPPEQAMSDESAGGRNKQLLLVLAVLGGVAVLGLAAFFLFFSGGEDEEDFGPLPPQGAASKAPEETKSPEAGGKVPPAFDGRVGRDPFEPLAAEAPVVVEQPQPELEPTDEPAPEPPAPAPTAPAPPAPAPTTSAPTPPPSTGTYKVKVVSVNPKKGTAELSVNGTKHTVAAGEIVPGTDGTVKLSGVSEYPNGVGYVTLKFGSEAPREVKEGSATTFKN